MTPTEYKEAQLAQPDEWESLLGAIARGWCYEENANKTMDTELALAIAKEVSALYAQSQREPVAYIHRNEYNEYRLEPTDNFKIEDLPVGVEVMLYTKGNT